MSDTVYNRNCLLSATESKIISKFVRKTFPTEIKFDHKISYLIRVFYFGSIPSVVKSEKG